MTDYVDKIIDYGKKTLIGLTTATYLFLTACGGGGGGSGGGAGGGTPGVPNNPIPVNKAPIVGITSPAQNANYLRGQQVNLNATAVDPDGDAIINSGWDPVPGLLPGGLANLVGNYNVPLTSTLGAKVMTAYGIDSKNAEGEAYVTINILNNVPVANENCPMGFAGSPLPFDASLSSDLDGTIISCSWDWGDGTPSYTETPTNAPDGTFDCITNHTFFNTGFYNVNLTVTDNDADMGQTTCTAAAN